MGISLSLERSVSHDQSSYSSLAGLHPREWAGDSWFADICLFLFIYWAAKPFVLVVRARLNARVAADLRSGIIFTPGNKRGGSPLKGLLARWDLSSMFLFLLHPHNSSRNIVKHTSLKMASSSGTVMLNLRCGRIKTRRPAVTNSRMG